MGFVGVCFYYFLDISFFALTFLFNVRLYYMFVLLRKSASIEMSEWGRQADLLKSAILLEFFFDYFQLHYFNFLFFQDCYYFIIKIWCNFVHTVYTIWLGQINAMTVASRQLIKEFNLVGVKSPVFFRSMDDACISDSFIHQFNCYIYTNTKTLHYSHHIPS